MKEGKKKEEDSQKAQELKKEELENVNGGVGCKKKFGIGRNGKDDWDW